MAIGAVVARILTQYSDKGSKAAQKDINKLGKQFDAFAKKSVRAFGLVAAATGALAVKIGKDSIQAAIRAQAEQNRLNQILLTTNGATLEQIAILNSQAEALERVGVVSAGNVKVAQSQLATFDLQASTIEKLTPAILDYVTAEKGATASASDFKSMTNGLAQALQGNFASLTRTGFVIDDATKKIISSGSESQRAAALVAVLNSTYEDFNKNLRNTPEGKIIALANSLDNLKTTLGLALLPIVEEFVQTLTTDVLPKISMWIEMNKKQLTEGLKRASDAVIVLVTNAIAFSSWIVNNMGIVKTMAALIAGMFVVGRIAAFATVLGKLTAAFVALRTAAGGAAIATAFATGGASLGSAAAALAIVGGAAAITGLKVAGSNIRAKKSKLESRLAGYQGSPGASDIAGLSGFKSENLKTSTNNSLLSFQNKLNNAKKKELSIEQQIINKMLNRYGLTLMTAEIEAEATAQAIKKNLNRQERIANAPTISLAAQGDGSAGGGSIINSGSPNISVSITTPHGTADDYVVDITNKQNQLAKRAGAINILHRTR